MHRLLLHFDELAIDHNLVELGFHGREELGQNIPEREVCAVPLKKRAANLWKGGAVKNELLSKNADGVGDVACVHVRDLCRRRIGEWCLTISDVRGRAF